jgi:hypothetical protein
VLNALDNFQTSLSLWETRSQKLEEFRKLHLFTDNELVEWKESRVKRSMEAASMRGGGIASKLNAEERYVWRAELLKEGEEDLRSVQLHFIT